MNLYSPLEQFEIFPLFSINFGFFYFSITNQTVILFVTFLVTFVLFYSVLKPFNNSLFIIPTRWQQIFEFLYTFILSIVLNNIRGDRSQNYFPLVFFIFVFLSSINLIGLVPYTFTVTSQFIVTFCLSLTVFIGINIVCIRTSKLEFFSLFLPSGTSFFLSFLLVPIEMVLYFFRPFSLAIRLFCNMTVGHILLKLAVGLVWSIMNVPGFLFFFHYLPLIVLFFLLTLELGIAIIQAFVFSLLICLYLDDVINMH
jgi:ATP synthase subunit 6